MKYFTGSRLTLQVSRPKVLALCPKCVPYSSFLVAIGENVDLLMNYRELAGFLSVELNILLTFKFLP